MPVYIVTAPGANQAERLVDAPNQASARNHVARSILHVEVAKGSDLFRLAKGGTELETANAEPAPVGPEENIGSLPSEDMNVTTADVTTADEGKGGKVAK